MATYIFKTQFLQSIYTYALQLQDVSIGIAYLVYIYILKNLLNMQSYNYIGKYHAKINWAYCKTRNSGCAFFLTRKISLQ